MKAFMRGEEQGFKERGRGGQHNVCDRKLKGGIPKV